ncbi:MAG TPA: calcium-binding protein, partial [Allosphingosinicella sp.]|nr:calcium-binding protein [Allosphingosinicella sp.]
MADINGTAGADLLFGAAAADLISGGDGNDVLFGGAGDDHLVGGDGDDVLRGEAGNDLLEGGAGNDDLSSTDQGNDTLAGGDGNDTLFADRRRAGDSLALDGGAGNDRLIIQLTAAATALTAAAGEGDDAVEVFALRSLLGLSLGAGRDLVTPAGLRTSVLGGGSIVISDFQAGAAGDRISFSSLSTADFTGWNPNANPFAAGFLKAAQSGADVVISASFTANGTFVDAIVLQNVLLADLTPDNLGGWTWDGSAVPAQTISGTGAAETLRGNGGADEMFGLDGDDILEGHAGADTLWGGEGNDILRGGQGADQVHGDAGNDTLTAETTGDSLFGEDGDDRLTLSAATGTGTVSGSGGAGNDTISISGSSATASFSVDAGSGADLVSISSLAGSAVIALGDGRDRLDIESFTKSPTSIATIEVTDFATGDEGDRLEWFGFLLRTLTAGDGSVRLLQSGADSLLQIDQNGGGDQYVTLITFRNTEAAAFTAYNLGGFAPDGLDVPGTTVTGTADPDILFGADGDDLIEGQDGGDTLLGFFGDDEIHGGGGDDSIFGSYGDDVIDGGAGNDIINAGQGDDLADGGEGNDQFIDNSSSGLGNKGFIGGAGDDRFLFFRLSNTGDFLVATGGEGDDFFQAQNTFSFGQFILDGGAGNDIFDVQGRGSVTLGAGVDAVRFSDAPSNANFQSTITVQDFAVGDLGDRLSFAGLVSRFTNFPSTANPFTSGYLKLVQNGSSTMLYADLDGPTGPTQDRLVGILNGVQKHSLTSYNIGGYGLPFVFGTGADETFQGTTLDDDFIGGGGNDIFLLGYGGKDFATGGVGNDLFYVATVNIGGAPNVTITGGGGSDILQVQGKTADMYVGLQAASFSGLPGTPITATGIGTVQLLSGFDSSRGWALNSAVTYNLQIANGFAPSDSPLIIDTTRLAASERLNLSSGWVNDADAVIKLVGGAGVDNVAATAGGSYLDGGGGDDQLFTGLGNDTLIGGQGADLLYVGASSGPSNVDILDAGEGNDRVLFFAVTGAVTLTLGAGSDTIEFSTAVYDSISPVIGRNVTVTDFTPGPGGDILDWSLPLFHYLSGQYGNPFETGYARLVQDGGDVLLQLSRLGDGNFLTLFRLQNHVVADFASGIGGFVPPQVNGGDDFLTGTGGDDWIDGGAGNDVIDGGAGADRMTGGTGNDIFHVDNAGDEAIEAAGEGTDEIRTGLSTYSLAGVPNVEKLTATSDVGHDFRGNAGDNVITGGGAIDVLRLQDGGNDTVFGGAGNDIIFFIGALTSA